MENAAIDADKRTKEVKEKLEVLNETKHRLVQVLKQVTYAFWNFFGVNVDLARRL